MKSLTLIVVVVGLAVMGGGCGKPPAQPATYSVSQFFIFRADGTSDSCWQVDVTRGAMTISIPAKFKSYDEAEAYLFAKMPCLEANSPAKPDSGQ
jgi:hypothetical protein